MANKCHRTFSKLEETQLKKAWKRLNWILTIYDLGKLIVKPFILREKEEKCGEEIRNLLM